MFTLSQSDVLNILAGYDKIIKRVGEVVDEIGFLDSEFDTLEEDKTEFTDDSVIVTAYDSHYDMYDSTSASFPLQFLFEDAKDHKDWYRNKKIAEEKQREQERKEAERKRELRQLEALKAKYE